MATDIDNNGTTDLAFSTSIDSNHVQILRNLRGKFAPAEATSAGEISAAIVSSLVALYPTINPQATIAFAAFFPRVAAVPAMRAVSSLC